MTAVAPQPVTVFRAHAAKGRVCMTVMASEPADVLRAHITKGRVWHA